MDLKLQYDKLLRYCYHKTKSEDLAEDIVQETFLKFWQSHSYEDTGKELAYLYTIARNLCTDTYRNQERNLEYPEDLPCPDSDPEQALNRIAVDTALEQLPEQLREMVVMRYVSELSAAEIGKIMNLSRFAVNRRVKEGLKLLKEQLKEGS